MAPEISTKTIEIENIAGTGRAQTMLRAETLVSGAGRESIEVLLADADAVLNNVEVQNDRVIAEGVAHCQAVYRQGAEATLRALTADAPFSQSFEIPGASPGMRGEACASVEHVEARYENGRMVFLITVSLSARASSLSPAEIITGVTGDEGIETEYVTLNSMKVAAESGATALVRGEIPLSAALDARTALTDNASVSDLTSAVDLGGIKVTGRVDAEILISSGVDGRPAAMVKSSFPFEQLVEVPEWLTSAVCVTADVVRIETRVEQGADNEDSLIMVETEVRIKVKSIIAESVEALSGVYATRNHGLKVTEAPIDICTDIICADCAEPFRGTMLLGENAPGVGSVIAVSAHPNISGFGTDGESVIDGVIEATVMYIPSGGGLPVSFRGEMPFSVKCHGTLNDTSLVCIDCPGIEATAIMSDRVEVRCELRVHASTLVISSPEIVTGIEEGEALNRRPGIILFWPRPGDNIWTIGRRYGIPVSDVRSMNGDSDLIEEGRAMVLKI